MELDRQACDHRINTWTKTTHSLKRIEDTDHITDYTWFEE